MASLYLSHVPMDTLRLIAGSLLSRVEERHALRFSHF